MYDVAARRAADAKYRLWKLGQGERLAGYRRDPVGYAVGELKLELTGDQRAMMESVVVHRRTAIKASHAIGKTFAAAVLACWWYDCWDQHICYVTAPSWKQALGLTFKQVKLLRRRLKLPGAIHETGWVKDRDKALEPGHFIQAVNAESGEGFQGEHTAPILVVMEEAPGVPHYIQAAAEGLMTSPECFPAGVRVSGPKVLGSAARWYAGDLVEVRTRGGRHLAVTPNHPVLTPEGWVAAGSLQEGDRVVGRRVGEGESSSVAGPDDEQVPAPIEKVAAAVGGAEGGRRSWAAVTVAEDFHGDGMEGEVCIVRADGDLGVERGAAIGQPAGQHLLVGRAVASLRGHGPGDLLAVFGRLPSASDGVMGRPRVATAGLRGHRLHAESVGLGDTADRHAAILEEADHRPGSGAVVAADRGGGLAVEVASDDGFGVGRGPEMEVAGDLGPSPDGNPGIGQVPEDRLEIDPMLAAELLGRDAGLVAADQVVEVRRTPFRGHVYNLQTETGWYLAEGLYVHNCRIVQVGNPTDEATGFGKACSDPGYNVLTVSVLDHPNIGLELEAKPPLFPEAVRLLWLAEMLGRECEVVEEGTGDAFEFWDAETIRAALEGQGVSTNPKARKWWYLPNAVFQGRALGIFPSQADEQVIPRGWLDRCGVLTPADPLAFGMDVARHGDDRTVIAWRRGPCLLGFRELRQMDNAAVTGALLMLLNEATDERREDPHAVPLYIDVTGGLGAGPCDFLAERGYNAVGVNASQMADDPETYPNQRSELWFQMRDRVRAREADFSALTAEERKVVFRELSTPKWKPDGRGRKVVEPKVEIKKRLGSSPDIADAVNLAFRSSLPVTVEDEDDAWGGARF